MKKVILTESQFNILVESQVMLESIFEATSLEDFKHEIKKYVKRMLVAGLSIGTIYTMVNKYCDNNNIPENTKQEVLATIEENKPVSDWVLADDSTIATVYNAVPAQCNDDFGNTASMFRLNLEDLLSQRVIAMERTFMNKLGLKYGDVVRIEGTNGYDGEWQIQDTMNKRFAGQHKIDILVPDNIRYGAWDNVRLYVLRDKSLTNKYRSQMAPQVSKAESKRQVEAKKLEFQRRNRLKKQKLANAKKITNKKR